MSKRCRLALLLCANAVSCVLFAQVTITEFPWEVDFSGSQPFTLVNGTQPNHWIWGSAAGNEAPCLHIGSDLASGNDYWVGIDPWSGPSALSRVYAYVDLAIPEFHHAIDLYFDVRVGGDNSDNLEVFILPVTALPLAGTNPSSLGPGVLQVGPSFQGIPEWESRHYSLSPQYAGQTIRLAFHWRNDWSGGVQPGAAVDNIRVTTSPCIAPFGAVLDDISSTTAMAHWQGISVAAAYHYELRTNGAPGSGTYGLYAAGTVGSEQVLLQGLMPGTLYRLYLRTDCSDSLTTWSPAYPFVTDPACGSAFVDPGGPTAPYGPLMDRTYVICPTGTANAVRVAFNNMSIGPGDRLEVYDGAEAVGAPKAVITSDAASTYVSDDHGGCLTFRFVSDGEWHGNGWYGTVSCGPRTGCTVWGVEVQQVDVDAVQVRWHCTGALMPFVLEHGDLGWTPGNYVWAGQGGSISFLDTAAAIITGLTPGGVHELEVRVAVEARGRRNVRE
jgi:hypothetical protein